MGLTKPINKSGTSIQSQKPHSPGEPCNNNINRPRFRGGWNLCLCSYATRVVFIFPKSIIKLDCIVKHLICTLIINNCLLILSVVTCNQSVSDLVVLQLGRAYLNDFAALGEISIA
jgi:hypothetical protein